jgi:hypothetical protein
VTADEWVLMWALGAFAIVCSGTFGEKGTCARCFEFPLAESQEHWPQMATSNWRNCVLADITIFRSSADQEYKNWRLPTLQYRQLRHQQVMPSTAIHIASISIALLASGGIATLSLFDIPELTSQPASRSLPSIRWLFSRGSHIFPTASALSASGFAYLAYETTGSFGQLFKFAQNSSRINGYLVASALTFGIAPFTMLMIPTNFELIRMNMEKGGSRSEESSKREKDTPSQALQSVQGDGEAEEFTDLSGPQTKTTQDTTVEEDEKVQQLLSNFGTLNMVRAVLIGAGGIVGLWTALST